MITIAIGFYTAHEYEKFRASATDLERWSVNYSEWLSNAEKTIRELEATGKTVQRVAMNLTEFELWCLTKGFENDAQSRSQYAAEIARIKGSPGLS